MATTVSIPRPPSVRERPATRCEYLKRFAKCDNMRSHHRNNVIPIKLRL